MLNLRFLRYLCTVISTGLLLCINNTRITNFQYSSRNTLITKGLYKKVGFGNTSS